jgi:hypothetical protein
VIAFVLSLLFAGTEPVVRPDTYTVNPRLTTGPIENFRELYVDPAAVPAQLKPAEAQSGTATDLSVRNDLTSWTEVTIAGTKIGVLDALTNGVIHGVAAGTYDVVMHYPNGFEKKLRVNTMSTQSAATTTTTTTTVAPAATPPASDGQKTP